MRAEHDGGKKKWSIMLFLLGLLSKVSVFPLPFALLLVDALMGKRVSWQNIKEKWPYFALSAAFLLLAVFGKKTQIGFEPVLHMLLALASIPLSLQHIFYPVGLTIFYPFVDPISIAHPAIWGGACMILAIAILTWVLRKQVPMLPFAVAWFVLLVGPSLLNVYRGGELGVPDIYLTSDRYVYLAIIGPVLCIGSLVDRWRNLVWAGIPIGGVLAVLTILQIQTWHNSESLFQQVIDVGQPSHVAYTNMGGYKAEARDLEAAESLYEHSLKIRQTTRVLNNLIQIKGLLGKYQDAQLLYDQYVALKPDDLERQIFLRKFLTAPTSPTP